MKSIKPLSLILVASTLMPASAHAWSWSDLVKPATIATGLAGFMFGSYIKNRHNTNDLIQAVRINNAIDATVKKVMDQKFQEVQNLQKQLPFVHAQKCAIFISDRLTSENIEPEIPNASTLANPKQFMKELHQKYPNLVQEWNDNHCAQCAEQYEAKITHLEKQLTGHNVANLKAALTAKNTRNYNIGYGLQVASGLGLAAYALYPHASTVVKNYLSNR